VKMNAKRMVLIFCAIVAVATVAGGYLLWGVAGEFSDLKAEDWRNVIFIVGGLTAAMIAAWRAHVADKQTQINEQVQITERFTRAVDLLGSENIYMRIGALHALERIGRDSESDVVAVLRLLSSFVRSQSVSRRMGGILLDGDDTPAPLDAEEGFAVISRLAGEYKRLLRNRESMIVDLSSSNLKCSLQFSKGCFFRFNFSFCNLSLGFFSESDFECANFQGAYLESSYFQDCNLTGVSFNNAILDGVNFGNADMTRAILLTAVCNRTNFSTAKNLTTKMLKDIIYDAETPPRIPDGVTLPPPEEKRQNLSGKAPAAARSDA